MSKESAKRSYEKHRAKRLADMRALYENERHIVFAHLGNECACCGEKEPMFLTLDHVLNDGYKHRASHAGSYRRMYHWFIKNSFPSGFQLLCMNCNQGKHRNGGVCPHQEGSTTRAQARSSKRSEALGPQT